MNYILVDGSYFIFYRYYALHVWWKNAKQEELDNPYENKEFLEKFESTLISKINEIPKKLKVSDYKKKNYKIIVGKDCSKKNIWRNALYGEYKANRIGEEGSKTEKEGQIVGQFFKHVYSNNLFKSCDVNNIIELDKLEADDCIALYSKQLLKNDRDCKIYIIASDCDYLQLINERLQLYDLKFKNIAENKKNFTDGKKNLFYKTVLGDKSDNIFPVFTKCGPKTVEKYYNDKDEFEKKLDEKDYREKYKLNNTLVNFDMIPQELQTEFNNKYIVKKTNIKLFFK